MLLLFVEKGLYQNATAPVKGEKLSLKIHRADLVDRKTVFQIGSFFVTGPQYFFLFP